MTSPIPEQIASALDAYCADREYLAVGDFIATHRHLPNIENYRADIARELKAMGFVRGFIRESTLASNRLTFDFRDPAALAAAVDRALAGAGEVDMSLLWHNLGAPEPILEAQKAIAEALGAAGYRERRLPMRGSRVAYVWQRGA